MYQSHRSLVQHHDGYGAQREHRADATDAVSDRPTFRCVLSSPPRVAPRRVSERGMSGRVLAVFEVAAPVAAAVLLLLLLAAVWVARIPYPFDLEWMEGGMLAHAWRLDQGLPLYVAPNPDFVPYIYPPGYSAVLAVLGKVFGLSPALGRVVSLFGTLAAAAAVPFVVTRHTARPVSGLVLDSRSSGSALPSRSSGPTPTAARSSTSSGRTGCTSGCSPGRSRSALEDGPAGADRGRAAPVARVPGQTQRGGVRAARSRSGSACGAAGGRRDVRARGRGAGVVVGRCSSSGRAKAGS